jgi:sulfite reductase beta subunit-like hemoprotein
MSLCAHVHCVFDWLVYDQSGWCRGALVSCRRVFELLAKLGLGDEPITMRMTGCPNGCARPYMAEIGFVGDGPNSYQVSFRRGLHGV